MDYRGKLVELAGPAEFSWREVADLVLDTTHRARVTDTEGMSMLFARGYGMLLEQLPNPLFTEDEVGRKSGEMDGGTGCVICSGIDLVLW